MLAYIKDQLENVLTNLDSVLHDDAIMKMMLLHLIKHSDIKGFNKVMDPEQIEQRTLDLENYLLNEIDGINYLVAEFNFDKCMDLLKLIPKERLLVQHFEMILALFKTGKRNKKFYEGRKPNYDDVQVIVDRVGCVMDNQKSQIEKESITHMREITRLVL
jgi:hypothetical protein